MNPTFLHRFRAHRRGRAFTLIELLTVIAIIGILAAILIPTIGRVRAGANAASCKSNLREMGRVFLLYANDNKGLFPSYTQDLTLPNGTVRSNVIWYTFLVETGYLTMNREGGSFSFANGIGRCNAVNPAITRYGSYGVNQDMLAGPTSINRYLNDVRRVQRLGSLRIWDIDTPSKFWLVGDCRATDSLNPDIETSTWYAFWPPTNGSFGTLQRPSLRHPGEVANAAMFDGSVRSFNESQLTTKTDPAYPWHR